MRGYTEAEAKWEFQEEKPRASPMTRIMLSIAAVTAVLCLEVSSSQAQYFGDEPWCAVMEIGDGDVAWDCEYRTVEACVPNVLAGNRGFCELNPYLLYAPATVAALQHPKRHARRQAQKHLHQH